MIPAFWRRKFKLFPCLALIVCACANTESQQEERPGTQSTQIPNSQQKEKASVSEYPILDQNNYKSFLINYFKENPERKIKLTTRLGEIRFRLFEDTPLHSSNFLMLVKRGYFNNTEFTRVVDKFVVQGGNNDQETEEIKRLLIGNYLIAPEMEEAHLHKNGALSMARSYDDNPEKLSSAYNFFFVQGQKFNEPQLLAIERDKSINIPGWKRDTYTSVGGAPHLDMQHTVFGEIYEGLDVLEKMSKVETDKSDWPRKPLIMQMEIINE